MKKIIAMLLALVMLLSLAACASSGKTDAPAAADTAAPAETTDTTDTAPAADTKTDGKTYKVAMICDSSINDGGWGAACYNAMVAAAEKKGWQTEVTDSISQDSYYDSIVAYCALGYDMIYAPGNQYTDAVLQAAENSSGGARKSALCKRNLTGSEGNAAGGGRPNPSSLSLSGFCRPCVSRGRKAAEAAPESSPANGRWDGL